MVSQFDYDAEGNLTQTTDPQVAHGAPGAEVGQGRYAYNYAGMRTRHLGSERGDIEYLYDGDSIIDEVHNNSTSLVAHYRYGDRLLSLTSGGSDQFYHYASLGTTANLTNAAGAEQVAYRTDPFGQITQQEGSSVNRHVFTGQEHDEQTGLIYFGARFYDPDVAGFINQDSYLGESTTPPSLHRYLYAYSNPTTYVDPDGHIVFVPFVAYLVYTAVNSAFDTAGDVATDEVLNAVTHTDSTTTVESTAMTFGENFVGNFATASAFGKVKKVKKIAKIAAAAEEVYDNSKTIQKVEMATEKVVEKVDDAIGAAKDKVSKSVTREKADGPIAGSAQKPDVGDSVAINPELQKRADAYQEYRQSKGLSPDQPASRDQFESFRRGNAGDNGKQLYPKKGNYKDPQVKQHGNTLNSDAAEIYIKRDAQGNYRKTGISKDASGRYSDAEIDGGSVDVIGTRSRDRATKLERFMVERKPGPDNKEPWAGKRDPNHPNYDPDYVPLHLRKKR